MAQRPISAPLITLCLAVSLMTAAPFVAQVPDTFTNLKIFPKDISQTELMGIMRGFSGALGVRCSHCHAGPDNLQGMDFATDELAPKRTARRMLKMVDAINDSHLAKLDTGRDAKFEVSCMTCHSGIRVPAAIDVVVEQKLSTEGLDSALAHYSALREEHYGSAAYDFSPRPLNSLGERLGRGGKLEQAVRVVELNASLHPEDGYTQLVLAGIHQAAGDVDAARRALERAVEIDPNNGWAKQRLEALKAKPKKD